MYKTGTLTATTLLGLALVLAGCGTDAGGEMEEPMDDAPMQSEQPMDACETEEPMDATEEPMDEESMGDESMDEESMDDEESMGETEESMDEESMDDSEEMADCEM